MFRLHYSPESRNDLAEIKEYISEEHDNPSAAGRMIEYIVKRIRGLGQFPEMGAMLSSVVEIDSNYRFLVCKKYLVFYRVEENNVFISRVLHGSRDCPSILFGELPQNDTE